MCIKVYLPLTRAVRDLDTVIFFSHTIPFPKVNLEDYLRQTATYIVTILTALQASATPSLEAGYTTRNFLLKIVTVLKRANTLPPSLPLEHTSQPQRMRKTLRQTLTPEEQDKMYDTASQRV